MKMRINTVRKGCSEAIDEANEETNLLEASASQKRPVARTSVMRDSDVFSCRLTSIDCTAGLEVYPVSHQLTQTCHTQEL